MKMRVFYRAAGHVPIWKVMDEGGFLARHGLEIELGSMEGRRARATEALLSGELDVLSGNHHNLYARRALKGEPFVHLAQAASVWKENWMVAARGIRRVEDLKGKRVVMDDFDGHTGLNVWLYLKQHGLEEGRDVALANGPRKAQERVRLVMSGEYDATFVRAVDQMRATAQGANVIELPTMPMIEGVTITTTTTYVARHEAEVRGLLHALVDAIHFFKTRREPTLEILGRIAPDVLKLQSADELACFYDNQAGHLNPKPYPTMEAIRNVFALGVKTTPEIKDFNPLILWDLHYLREIDDSGYIDRLWA